MNCGFLADISLDLLIFALQTRKNIVSSIYIQNGVAFIYFRLTVSFEFCIDFFKERKDENLWCQTWWPSMPWSNFFKVFNSDRTERWCCCVVALWDNEFTKVPRQLIRSITCFSYIMMISLDQQIKMADYLINRPFCSDDFIRSY